VWRDRPCTRTATLAQKLICAGMIVMGKTHTVEFSFGGWGTNQHLGHAVESLGRQDPSHARRLQQRFGRRGRRPYGSLRARHGYRRVGAHTGLLVRHHGAQNHHRPHQHVWRCALSPTLDTPAP
jgi:hypothetical protein